MSALRRLLRWRCPATLVITYRSHNPVASRLPHDRWATAMCVRRPLHIGHHHF